MKIGIGSDHAGYAYKQAIIAHLQERGHDVVDFGAHSEEATDYPLYIRPVALAVAAGQCERGIVLGGSGNGEAITANRTRGIRCALCWSHQTATLCRQHNDANVLSLGQRTIPLELALEIVDLFLTTPFENARHTRRIQMIDEY